MQSFLLSSLLLGGIVAASVAVIVKIRSWRQGSSDDRGDWENALAGYKDLRDRGVLSDEEYRKIRTLVEPHVQSLPMAPSRSGVPAAEQVSEHNAEQSSEEPN